MRARLIFTREKLSVWSYRFRGFSRRFRSFGHSCWYSSVIVSLSMRPFRSRVQTKLFILFACTTNSLLKKQEKRKKRKTKQKVLEPPQSQQKSFLLLLSPNPLSLSLMKSFLLSFFSALEISFLFEWSMKNLSRIVCAHHPPKRITRSLRRSTTTTLQRTRVNSSLLSTLTRVNTRKHTFK